MVSKVNLSSTTNHPFLCGKAGVEIFPTMGAWFQTLCSAKVGDSVPIGHGINSVKAKIYSVTEADSILFVVVEY